VVDAARERPLGPEIKGKRAAGNRLAELFSLKESPPLPGSGLSYSPGFYCSKFDWSSMSESAKGLGV
jgi:hypothetical protein